MQVNHAGKFLVELQTPPFKRLPPVFKETPCPSLALVGPQLTKRFLEQIGCVQTLVCLKQLGQRTSAIECEISVVGEQRVFLALDELAARARQPGIFALAHLVQRLPQMSQHVGTCQRGCALQEHAAGWRYERLSTYP